MAVPPGVEQVAQLAGNLAQYVATMPVRVYLRRRLQLKRAAGAAILVKELFLGEPFRRLCIRPAHDPTRAHLHGPDVPDWVMSCTTDEAFVQLRLAKDSSNRLLDIFAKMLRMDRINRVGAVMTTVMPDVNRHLDTIDAAMREAARQELSFHTHGGAVHRLHEIVSNARSARAQHPDVYVPLVACLRSTRSAHYPAASASVADWHDRTLDSFSPGGGCGTASSSGSSARWRRRYAPRGELALQFNLAVGDDKG